MSTRHVTLPGPDSQVRHSALQAHLVQFFGRQQLTCASYIERKHNVECLSGSRAHSYVALVWPNPNQSNNTIHVRDVHGARMRESSACNA